MRKTILVVAVFTLLAFVAGLKAQSSPVSIIEAPSGSTITNCGTPSLPAICVVVTGAFVCPNATGCSTASAWVALGGSAAAPALTLNGTTKTLPATFTITAAAPTITATGTAPSITAN